MYIRNGQIYKATKSNGWFNESARYLLYCDSKVSILLIEIQDKLTTPSIINQSKKGFIECVESGIIELVN